MTVLTALVVAGLLGPARAAECVPKLPCAFPASSPAKASGDHCTQVFNTCNTSITSTFEDEQTGEQRGTPPIRPNDTGIVCAQHPLELVGHTINGPGGQ